MRSPLPLVAPLIVGLFAGGLVGCFSDQVAPPTFRYACDADDDCEDTERCLDGLCLRPCTQATFAADCGQGSFSACLNGICSNLCQLEDDACPGSQSCLELPFDLGGGGGGRGGGGSSEELGLCGTACTPDGGDCPSGEVCFEGLCVASCDADDDCSTGLVCTDGFCVPAQ